MIGRVYKGIVEVEDVVDYDDHVTILAQTWMTNERVVHGIQFRVTKLGIVEKAAELPMGARVSITAKLLSVRPLVFDDAQAVDILRPDTIRVPATAPIASTAREMVELKARLDTMERRLSQLEQRAIRPPSESEGKNPSPSAYPTRQGWSPWQRVEPPVKPTTRMRPLDGHLMVDEHGIIWKGERAVGTWGVNGDERSGLPAGLHPVQ